MFAPFASAVCCENSPHARACGLARLEKRTQAKAALAQSESETLWPPGSQQEGPAHFVIISQSLS